MSLPRHLPQVATRLWVRLYTAGLPAEATTSRRAEVDSDLYERSVETPSLLEDLYCLIAGIPDDLVWRASQISPTLVLAQGLTLAVFVGAITAFLTGHMLNAFGFWPYLAAIPAVFAAGVVAWLLTRTEKEEVVQTSTESPRTHVVYQRIVSGSAFLAPPLALAGILMIGFDYHPQEDNSDIVRLAADHQARFAGGYVLYAVSLTLLAIAVMQVSALARGAGSHIAGAIVPGLFLLSTAFILVGGHGLQGVALALVTQAGLDAQAYYLEASNDSGVAFAAFIAGIVAGLSLLALASAVWRTHLLGGVSRIAVSSALVLLGVVFGLTSGWTVTIGTVLIPVFTAIAFYPFAWRDLSSRNASHSVSGGVAAASNA
jgi:hypothetical protein